MRPVQSFTVAPALPDKLADLVELAHNVWWSWNHEAIELFRRLDRDLWEVSQHNPVLMLGSIDQERLEAAAADEAFLAHSARVCEAYRRYLAAPTWFSKGFGAGHSLRIAYFSAEFGLTECLPIYSGGLGILSGDHLKSASDLGLPLVGVGLLYQQGYFRQYLTVDGWQQEQYPNNDFYSMPLRLERTQDGKPLMTSVEYPGGPVFAQVWRVQVGRVPLYLLDTNIPENSRREDRDITDQLYGGDLDMRIRQEMMLGIGGLRALDALGRRPTVCHMNEGHSAFLALERIRLCMQQAGTTFEEAVEATSAGNVFTTHTPVPAGNDVFPTDLIERYLGAYYRSLGLSQSDLLALGREDPADTREGFCMTVLALRLSAHRNGVSRLHGTVSRQMWRRVWPQLPQEEIPIPTITNGVHAPSWISHDMADLYDRYLGPRWREEPADQSIWEDIEQIPGEELWRTHERRRERMVAFARRRLRTQLERRGAPSAEIAQADEVLNPNALTIGFARRSATYKRAALIFRNPERLARILTDRERPVQIIIAGKAHPRDNPGKELIRTIVQLARREDLRRYVVFVEDYDMVVARYLVQGCDVWLNTPRRLLEASGTSGMKATANGAINMSILDGWWDEAYRANADIGWAIGRGELYNDYNYQDDVESNAIYDMLEKEIVPLFYTRGRDGLPRGWIARMKAAMRLACPVYNTNRVVREYAESCYLLAQGRYESLNADRAQHARALAAWKKKVRAAWPRLSVLRAEATATAEPRVGAEIPIRAVVNLADLTPDDVTVQVYFGTIDPSGEIARPETFTMNPTGKTGPRGSHEFAGSVRLRRSGRFGLSVRILPNHPALSSPYESGLITWSQSA